MRSCARRQICGFAAVAASHRFGFAACAADAIAKHKYISFSLSLTAKIVKIRRHFSSLSRFRNKKCESACAHAAAVLYLEKFTSARTGKIFTEAIL